MSTVSVCSTFSSIQLRSDSKATNLLDLHLVFTGMSNSTIYAFVPATSKMKTCMHAYMCVCSSSNSLKREVCQSSESGSGGVTKQQPIGARGRKF